jgi:hypothetical protein
VSQSIDPDLAWYVFRYFGDLMNPVERRAWMHLAATVKLTGRSDVAAQKEARTKPKLYQRNLTDDPEALRLASSGWDAFIANTAQRILTESGDRVFLNCCPRCGKLTKTPKARQCRFCRHDWHA